MERHQEVTCLSLSLAADESGTLEFKKTLGQILKVPGTAAFSVSNSLPRTWRGEPWTISVLYLYFEMKYVSSYPIHTSIVKLKLL